MSDNDAANTAVFISYAREDSKYAERLYNELKKAGFKPWLDKHNLVAGQNWENEIENAIRKSRYFIPLFSNRSVKKIGYIHNEFKFALEVFKRYPPNMIFAIPVRLDNCEIPYAELKPIHHADLFPEEKWKEGINSIIQAFKFDYEHKDEQTDENNDLIQIKENETLAINFPINQENAIPVEIREKFKSVEKIYEEQFTKSTSNLSEGEYWDKYLQPLLNDFLKGGKSFGLNDSDIKELRKERNSIPIIIKELEILKKIDVRGDEKRQINGLVLDSFIHIIENIGNIISFSNDEPLEIKPASPNNLFITVDPLEVFIREEFVILNSEINLIYEHILSLLDIKYDKVKLNIISSTSIIIFTIFRKRYDKLIFRINIILKDKNEGKLKTICNIHKETSIKIQELEKCSNGLGTNISRLVSLFDSMRVDFNKIRDVIY